MARKKSPPAAQPTSQPVIYQATVGTGGRVTKGALLSRIQAEAARQAGLDVVVCGPDLASNRSLAGAIEKNANGSAKRCPPHARAGPYALPHYQPDPRPPAGHTFMKLRTGEPSKEIMRFFTHELYRRFNSDKDDNANRANEEWENALEAYQNHLESLRGHMPSPVRKIADLCLHDAELLACAEEIEPLISHAPAQPAALWSAMAILSLKQDNNIVSVHYLLWDRVRQHSPPSDWPFSALRRHGFMTRSTSRLTTRSHLFIGYC